MDCYWRVRSSPACSLLGFDNVSDHSSLTGIRWYALALSLLRPLRLPFPTPLAV
ncbi:MAG: hypothetical protein ACI9TI_001293, partial [Natronomonas sp.]